MKCQMATESGTCGRTAGVKTVLVRAPGWSVPERRAACARCRKEESPTLFPPAALRAMCPVCQRGPVVEDGVCLRCKSTVRTWMRLRPFVVPGEDTITARTICAMSVSALRRMPRAARLLKHRRRLQQRGA